ncbi:unnamed protein product, partial [Closterium sp. NIES-53]
VAGSALDVTSPQEQWCAFYTSCPDHSPRAPQSPRPPLSPRPLLIAAASARRSCTAAFRSSRSASTVDACAPALATLAVAVAVTATTAALVVAAMARASARKVSLRGDSAASPLVHAMAAVAPSAAITATQAVQVE